MTTYRLATKDEDFGFPTVMAERNNVLVGYIASSGSYGEYCPSIIDAINVHVLMKMFKLYDKTLESLGQQFYMIHVREDDGEVIGLLNNWEGVVFNKEKDGFLWYIRRLGNEFRTRRRSQRTTETDTS